MQLRAGGFVELIRETGQIGLDDVLVVVAPELASWRADLGPAALDDLRAGCALSIGPIFDGGLYLLAATGAGLRLVRDGSGDDADGDGADLTGPAAMAKLIGLAERTGIEVGPAADRAGSAIRGRRPRAAGRSTHGRGVAQAVESGLGGRDLNPSFRDQNPAS